jgi:hypothetical protein
LPIQPPL